MLRAQLEDEKETIKSILKNHGIDNPIMSQSICSNLFNRLEIQTKKKY